MIYEFTPTQDLHGYEEPWAPGAGKNKFGLEFVENNTFTLEGGYYRSDVPMCEAGTYKWTGIAYASSVPGLAVRLNDLSTQHVMITSGTIVPTGNFVFADDAYLEINYTPSGFVSAVSAFKGQLEEGSTATDWSPYENICPLIGYNIWDPSQDQMIPVYSGYVDANANKLYLHPVYEEYDGEELVGPWMSSMDKYTEEGTPTTGAFVVDFGGEVTEYDITDFMLQTLLDSLGVRRFITSGAMLLNSLMDQAQGRVRSEEELLNRSLPLHVIAIGEDLPTSLTIKKPISDVLPGLPGKIKI